MSLIEKPDWVKKLEAEKCECVMCDVCRGTGTIPTSVSGRYLHYCDWCIGGVVEECERCTQLNDWMVNQP